MSNQGRYLGLLGGLAFVCVLLAIVSILTGPAAVGFSAAIGVLFSSDESTVSLIINEVRLPRTLLAITIGGTLGLSGAALQGVLRNPLAEPGLLGVSAWAALGAVLAVYTGLSTQLALALPLFGFLFAIASVLVLLALAGPRGSVLMVILAGVALSSFAAAMTSLALNLAPNPFAALEIVFWLLGSLADRSMIHFWLSLPFMALGWVMLLALARSVDALTLGEETARGMGINMNRVRLLATIGTAVSVGAATSVAGAIGFVGLVVPHALRPLVGSSPSRLLPVSFVGGAVLLLCADLATRLMAPERELKIGVLTALIGAPFFFWLVIRHRRQLI